jgi:hypothetical protein
VAALAAERELKQVPSPDPFRQAEKSMREAVDAVSRPKPSSTVGEGIRLGVDTVGAVGIEETDVELPPPQPAIVISAIPNAAENNLMVVFIHVAKRDYSPWPLLSPLFHRPQPYPYSPLPLPFPSRFLPPRPSALTATTDLAAGQLRTRLGRPIS